MPSLAQLAELRTQPGYSLELMRYTAPFVMSGHPMITLPAGFTRDRLPWAYSWLVRIWEEVLVWTGRVYQNATDWDARRPPIE